MEPGGCGSPEYGWLPAAQVGVPLWAEEDTVGPFSPENIDVLLSTQTRELSPVPYGARLFRFRYTSQDRGEPVEATGIVSVPWLPGGTDEEFPVVLWLHGTTGFADECAPSRLGLEHTLANYVISSLGYVVVTPDYIGLDAGAELDEEEDASPRHAYMNIEQTAIGSWDMVRAVRDYFQAGDYPESRLSNRVVIWGHSQGGHAAFASDLLQPYYAPEFEVVALVSSIAPTDLLAHAERAFREVGPGTMAQAAFLVSQHYWYGARPPLEELLASRRVADLPAALFSSCDVESLLFQVLPAEDVFAPDIVSAVRDGDWGRIGPWGCYVEENSLTDTRFRRLNDSPALMVIGELDELVHAPVEHESFEKLCERGYRLELLECAGAGHIEGGAWSLLEQIAWVRDRLAGEPIPSSRLCVRSPPVRCSGQPE